MEALNFMEPVITRLVEDCSESDLKDAANTLSSSVHSSCEVSPLTESQKSTANDIDSRILRGSYLYSPGIRHCDKVVKCLHVLKVEWKPFQQWCEQVVRNRRISISCIGDGSGVETVGVVLGLEDILFKSGTWARRSNRNQFYLFDKIRMTACQMDCDDFDNNSVYPELVSALRKRVQNSGLASVLSSGHTLIDPDFPLNGDAKEAIGCSAIVTLVTFFQSVQNNKYEAKRVVKNIMNAMRPGALLLAISEIDGIQLSSLKAAGRQYGLRLIHNRKLTFKMNEAVMEKYGSELMNIFKVPPVQEYTVITLVWQKVTSITPSPSLRKSPTYASSSNLCSRKPQVNDATNNRKTQSTWDLKDANLVETSNMKNGSVVHNVNGPSCSSKHPALMRSKSSGGSKFSFSPFRRKRTVSTCHETQPSPPSTPATPVRFSPTEHVFKILVVGDIGTGKTSLISRYVYNVFPINYVATLGVEFALKVIEWNPQTLIRLQLWDIAGQEGFQHMTRVYYKEADGAVIVFDVSRPPTLEAVAKWKNDLDSKVSLDDGSPVPCILLANKSDLPMEGTINNPRYIDRFCEENGFITWFLTSAKGGMNIDEAMKLLVSKIMENQTGLGTHSRDMNSVSLHQQRPSLSAKDKKKCC